MSMEEKQAAIKKKQAEAVASDVVCSKSCPSLNVQPENTLF